MALTPLHTLTRAQVVFPRMATERFLREKAEACLSDARRSMHDAAARLLETASPLVHLPGFLAGSCVSSRRVVVFEAGSHMLVGGVAQGTVWVDDRFRGRGVGTEALILAFATGTKAENEFVFFSPQGYANRSAAHRRAVARAVSAGESVPDAVLRDYRDDAAAHAARRESHPPARAFKADLPDAAIRHPPSWPLAPDILRLRAQSGRYPDARDFADAETGVLGPASAGWTVHDSLGDRVDLCSGWKASLYAGLREYTVRELAPGPMEVAAWQRHAALHSRASALWREWDDRDERGCIPVRSLSSVKGRHAACAHAAFLVAAATGSQLARPRRDGCAPAWARRRRGSGFEVVGPMGRLWLCVRIDPLVPTIVQVRDISCSPGSHAELRSTAEHALHQAAGRLGMAVHMADAPGLRPQ